MAVLQSKGIDKFKNLLSSGLIALSIGLFYYFSDESLLFRVLGIAVAVIVAASVFLTTDKGRDVASFLQAARLELRKMIWPTKTETSQTTLIVIVAVIIVALFLWLVDLLLRMFMRMVIQ